MIQGIGVTDRGTADERRSGIVRGQGVLARLAVSATGVVLLVYLVYLVLDPFGRSLDPYFDNGVPDALTGAAAIACFYRAVAARRQRGAWFVIGLGMASTTIAEIIWNGFIAKQADPPYPSIADFFYLAFYPLMFVGLTMLALRNVGRVRASIWLHSAIAVLTVAALDAALVFDPVHAASSASGWEHATNLAYPLADLLIVIVAVGVWALSGWRPNASWTYIGAAMITYAIGDAIYAYQVANDTFAVGTLVDITWPLAAALMMMAALRPGEVSLSRRRGAEAWLFVPTGFFSLIAIGILAWDHFDPVGTIALILALGAALATICQLGLAFVENLRLIERAEKAATSDVVTGLPNRRKLVEDLERACADARDGRERLLGVFDLNNFKSVNDTYGHAAGDELLARFGRRLTEIVDGFGAAYRLGGDEFCVILDGDLEAVAPLLEQASAALIERGEHINVTSSFGYAIIPRETRDPDEALSIADHRMYEVKRLLFRGEGMDRRRRVPAALRTVDAA